MSLDDLRYWFLATLVAVLSFGIGTHGAANAFVLNGCKFPGPNPQIVYTYSQVTATWRAAFLTATTKWNQKTPAFGGDLVEGSSTNIKVYDAIYPGSWWGLASGGCDSGGFKTWYALSHCPGSNPCVRIQFNTRTTENMTSGERYHVATHEIGHALGLAHSSLNCGNPVVMRSDPTWVLDNCGLTQAPWQNDVDGVDALY